MPLTKPLYLLFLSVTILGLSCGCATLPDVAEKMDVAPTAQEPPKIISAKGELSQKQSQAIMERLKRSVDPTDILERYIAVVESVTESPLPFFSACGTGEFRSSNSIRSIR